MIIIIYGLLVISTPLESARSPHRVPDPLTPAIITYWDDDPSKKYELLSSHLQAGPLLTTFDIHHFESHTLPTGPITYRNNPDQSILGEELINLAEEILDEIHQKKNNFSSAIILKDRDFKYEKQAGSLIIKFKSCPFVLKLFIETPESFINPFDTSFETMCMFMMSGSNRFVRGFGRIKNLDNMCHLIAQDDTWYQMVDFPRKWFWIPKNNRCFVVETRNLGSAGPKKIKFPSIYGIFCDAIDIERPFSLKNRDDRQKALSLSNYTDQCLDPNIQNYVIEKETKKIVAIDTEHFPSMIGTEEIPQSETYWQWYSHLVSQMVKITYGRTKRERRLTQFRTYCPFRPFESQAITPV